MWFAGEVTLNAAALFWILIAIVLLVAGLSTALVIKWSDANLYRSEMKRYCRMWREAKGLQVDDAD